MIHSLLDDDTSVEYGAYRDRSTESRWAPSPVEHGSLEASAVEVTRVYLDHQASTPMARGALDEMLPLFSSSYANPHSDGHAAGWEAAELIEQARGRVAAAVGAESEEIVFTSGATEANNLAILGVARARRDRRRIVISAIEHKSVLATARAATETGCEVVIIPVDRNGLVDMIALGEAVDDTTLLVSIGFVNNEMGAVQDMAAIASVCRRSGALLHSDAAQGLAWDAVRADEMGVDLLSLSAHKAGGPKGVGALYVGRAAAGSVSPIIHGGEQESGLRSGTLPTPLCVGFGAACLSLPSTVEVKAWRTNTLELLERLRAVAPSLSVNGELLSRHPGNLNLRFPDVPADILLARLQPEVAVARGSACTSGQPEPSHVLRAIGLTAAAADECLRISTSRWTTSDEIGFAVDAFARALGGVV